MEMYLIKSAACLAILERENMHFFKRFYLLFTLFAAAIIPLIAFKTYIEIPITTHFISSDSSEAIKNQISENPYSNYRNLVWVIYFLGIIFFSIKFCRNIWELFYRIRKNPKVKKDNLIQVLLKEKLPPHSFFQYVFLNKALYEKNKIPTAVLKHEEAHSHQRHSLDIIFLELLQIIVWFNPLIYLLKKSVKLNHEFLADNAVLQAGYNAKDYQNTLLSFSSGNSCSNLVNPLNYSSIKKRLTVMKTHTSKKAIWIKSLLVLPLLTVLIYSCSSKEVQLKESKNLPEVPVLITVTEDIQIEVREGNKIFLNGNKVTLKNLSTKLNKVYNDFSKEKRQQTVNASITTFGNVEIGLLTDIKDIIHDYGVKEITVQIAGEIKSDFPQELNPSSPATNLISESPSLLNQGLKSLKIVVNGQKIEVNGKRTSVSQFSEAVNRVTQNWSKKDYQLFKLSFQFENGGKNLRDELSEEYKKTELYKIKSSQLFEEFPPLPPLPPLPPSPPSPAKYIAELKNEGAVFYVNKKPVSAEKILELIDGKNFNIMVTKTNSKPEVYIDLEQ